MLTEIIEAACLPLFDDGVCDQTRKGNDEDLSLEGDLLLLIYLLNVESGTDSHQVF